MEIVLAIALTSVVMYLLTTAIELYMIRVDSSRTRVESAQLARTILDQMAADLTATRLYALTPAPAPAATGGGGNGANNNQSAAGGGTSGGAGSRGSSSSGSSSVAAPASVQGLYGTVEEIRIDRGAAPNWERAARDVAPEDPTTAADLPRSVRYYFVDGDRLSSQQLAQRGISEEDQRTEPSVTGLYRETMVTASLGNDADPLDSPTQRDGATVELLAPEVVKFEIAYFDGTQLVDQWDSLADGALPAGVEVRLTLYEPTFYQSAAPHAAQSTLTGPQFRESELVEYRRFVRMPNVSPPEPAEALLPQAGNNQGGQPGGGQGGPGGPNGQNGGAQNGQQGGGNGNQ